MKRLQIGIIGSAGPQEYPNKKPDPAIFDLAYKLGKLVAQNNAILVTGGKSGIMETAAKGAQEAGGITVGVVKGCKRYTSNPFIDFELVSGIDSGAESALLVLSCDGIIGIGGGAGTLQELTFAYRNKKCVVLINTLPGWSQDLAGKFMDERKITRFLTANSPEQAIAKLLKSLKGNTVKGSKVYNKLK